MDLIAVSRFSFVFRSDCCWPRAGKSIRFFLRFLLFPRSTKLVIICGGTTDRAPFLSLSDAGIFPIVMTRQIRRAHRHGGSVCENDVWSVSAEHKGVDNGNEGNNGPRPPTKYQLKLGRRREREEERIVLIVRRTSNAGRGTKGERRKKRKKEYAAVEALRLNDAWRRPSEFSSFETVARNGSSRLGFLFSRRDATIS